MAERFDIEDRDWPLRPWIMAAIGALGGLIFHLLDRRSQLCDAVPGVEAGGDQLHRHRHRVLRPDRRAAPLDLVARFRRSAGAR